jgi:hypothetical protein
VLTLVLLVVAAILFALAGLGVGSKYNLVALGLLAFVLTLLLPKL